MLLKIFCVVLLANGIVHAHSSWHDLRYPPWKEGSDMTESVMEVFTESPSECPNDKSIIGETDLKNTFNNIIADYNIYNLINDSYYNVATAVRDSITKQFEAFLCDIQNRPHHLHHILDDIATKQDEIKPKVNEILAMLNKYSDLEKDYKAKFEVASKLKRKLDLQKSICAQTCGHPEDSIVSRFDIPHPPKPDTLYCISVAELYEYIPKKFNAFIENITQELAKRIAKDEIEYNNKLKSIKDKVKELALEKFGKTMYDILFLLDDMYHLKKYINSINLDDVVVEILQYFSQIGPQLQKLELYLPKYAKYCRNCNNNQYIGLRQGIAAVEENELDYIWDKLAKDNLKDIQNNIDTEYNNFFAKLEEKLDNTNASSYISKMEIIQQQINIETNDRITQLQQVKDSISISSINNLILLKDKSKNLAQQIEDALNDITPYIM